MKQADETQQDSDDMTTTQPDTESRKSYDEFIDEMRAQVKAELAESIERARNTPNTANIFSDYWKVLHGMPVDWEE